MALLFCLWDLLLHERDALEQYSHFKKLRGDIEKERTNGQQLACNMGLSCFDFFSSTLFDTKKHLMFEDNVLLKCS